MVEQEAWKLSPSKIMVELHKIVKTTILGLRELVKSM